MVESALLRKVQRVDVIGIGIGIGIRVGVSVGIAIATGTGIQAVVELRAMREHEEEQGPAAPTKACPLSLMIISRVRS